MKNLFYLIIISVLISACRFSTPVNINASAHGLIDTIAGSCPFITADQKGNPVVSWVRQVDSATRFFCFAVSSDNGKSFGKPVVVAGSGNVHPHGENIPKVIFKPSGEIIAAWGAANPNPKNKYSGLVYYSQSFDGGKTWSRVRNLTSDTGSFDQRYFDMALLPSGEAAIVWLDNRKQLKEEGSGLYYAVTRGRNGFEEERLISQPCCQCCRTDLYVDKNKNIHVLYRAIINDSIRDMVHIASVDGGKTFSAPVRISADDWVITGCPHTGPAMAENKNGLYFTWFTGGKGSGIYLNGSTDGGKTFSERDSVSGKASKHCQVATLANNNLVVVWNERFQAGTQFSNSIGVELRDEHGKRLQQRFISSQNDEHTYPVLLPLKNNAITLAFTSHEKGRDYVRFQTVSF